MCEQQIRWYSLSARASVCLLCVFVCVCIMSATRFYSSILGLTVSSFTACRLLLQMRDGKFGEKKGRTMRARTQRGIHIPFTQLAYTLAAQQKQPLHSRNRDPKLHLDSTHSHRAVARVGMWGDGDGDGDGDGGELSARSVWVWVLVVCVCV